MHASAPLLRLAEHQPRLAVAGDLYVILADSNDTGGQYAMFEALVPPGGGPPPHVHSREDEGFYILEGEVAFTIAGVRRVAANGAFVHAPRNVPHAFRNETSAAARMLIWVTPGGFEQFFREVGTEVPPGGPPPVMDEEHFAKIMSHAPRYGVQILVP